MEEASTSHLCKEGPGRVGAASVGVMPKPNIVGMHEWDEGKR